MGEADIQLYRPHSALDTAELLYTILRQIDHPRTLAKCACVSQKWHQSSIPILWEGSEDEKSPWRSPEFYALIALSRSPARFRYYSSFIEKLLILDARYIGTNYDLAVNFFRPNLWKNFRASSVQLDLGLLPFRRDDLAHVLIQPALKSLVLYNGYYDDAFLQYLNDNSSLHLCTMIREHNMFNISNQAIKNLIEHHPLKHLGLCGINDEPHDRTYEAALAKPTLQHLWINSPHSSSNLKVQPLSTTTNYSNIRTLNISGNFPLVKDIFQQLPKLEILSVKVENAQWDICQQVLRPIVICGQLRELYIHCPKPLEIRPSTAADFISFAQNCPLINTLEIGTEYQDTASIDTDEYISSSFQILTAVKYWPDLKFFYFTPHLSLISEVELSIVAIHCPKLESLWLNAGISYEPFGSETFKFPSLRRLKVSYWTTNGSQVPYHRRDLVAEMRAGIEKAAPRIEVVVGEPFAKCLDHAALAVKDEEHHVHNQIRSRAGLIEQRQIS